MFCTEYELWAWLLKRLFLLFLNAPFFFKEIHNNFLLSSQTSRWIVFVFHTFSNVLNAPFSPPQLSLGFDRMQPVVKQCGWSSSRDSWTLKYVAYAHFMITYLPQPRLTREISHFFPFSLLSTRLCTQEILILRVPGAKTHP